MKYQPASLTLCNSYRLAAEALACAFPRTLAELEAAFRGSPAAPRILGHGNNIILSRTRYQADQPLVCLRHFETAVRVEGDRLYAGAGARLRDVCRTAARAGLSGLENLWDIPGSIGGAVYMNAGAYGSCFFDVVEEIEAFSPGQRTVRRFARSECGHGYRASFFQGTDWVILAARLRLTPGDPREILAAMGRIGKLRRSRFPYNLPSAGSVFKRPANAPPVGAMMERLGLKGLRIGDAQISTQHGGFIVNVGQATAADILAVADTMRQAAREHFGVELEMEQVVI